MFTLTVQGKFDAAHFLPNYEGDCANMHGHTWRVEASYCTGGQDNLGISFDFKKLKAALDSVLARFDHRIINQTIPFPTAECLAVYIFEALSDETIDYHDALVSVTVHETDTSKVTYTPYDGVEEEG